MNLPHGPFSIIYADPPWAYDNCIVTAGESVNSASKFHYPTMGIGEIESLPVKKISATDALLFLWTTCPFLEHALRVGRAWGFTYKTVAFIWEKMRVNPGFYTMGSTELCLVFKKGKIPTPRGARNIRQFYQASPGEHSVKPGEIRQRIDALFPDPFLLRLEMFARSQAPGWTVWGNQSQGEKLEFQNLEQAKIYGEEGRKARENPHYDLI